MRGCNLVTVVYIGSLEFGVCVREPVSTGYIRRYNPLSLPVALPSLNKAGLGPGGVGLSAW